MAARYDSAQLGRFLYCVVIGPTATFWLEARRIE